MQGTRYAPLRGILSDAFVVADQLSGWLGHGNGNGLQIRRRRIRPRLQRQRQRDRAASPAALRSARAGLHAHGCCGEQQRQRKRASPASALVAKDA